VNAPSDFPIAALLPAIRESLARHPRLVLEAPPGAGKTTQVPPALLDARWLHGRRILMLEPRRIAARAAAARMAGERGERVGETIGYRVRLDAKVGPGTRIEVVTEGVFTRTILNDPKLRGVAAVLFDEFHERSLEGDLGLALARDAQAGLRPDLRLVVMSATLDVARVAILLDDAPVIQCEGRMYPVTVRYRPRDPNARLEKDIASAVRGAIAADPGSALVFLPGAREIERAAEALRAEISDPSIDVRPLYGAMSPADQDAAIAPAHAGRRKIVLATSIAETSLTIEGVRIVIDSGLSRRPRFEPALGLSRLETVRASQASIEQRRGRAGRIEPGVCWRLWSEGETRALPAFDRPEMLDADLSGLVLDLAAWGIADPATLAWLDPPPRPAWEQATDLLARIGALDGGRLTEHGAALSRLSLPPRLAHMVLAAARQDEVRLAARLAVLLTEQGLGGRDIDLRARLSRFAHEGGARAEAARRLADRLAKQAGGAMGNADPERAGLVLALGFPDRVAKARGANARGGRQDFLMANGRAAGLQETDPLARERFIIVADAGGQADRAQIMAAAPIDEADVERVFADVIETKTQISFDAETGAVRGRRSRVLGPITLSQGPLEALAESEIASALIEGVRAQGIAALPWSDDALQLRARVALMRRLEGDAWPDWSDAALLASLEAWLPVAGARKLADLEGRLSTALSGSLPYPLQRRLEEAAPACFTTPAEGVHRIDYTAEGGPALSVRLQELFGLAEHPRVAGQALTLHLLSPAGRPVQTTRDLSGFWRGSYAGVRADMRGRYPKHPWPEDPLAAAPTRRAKPRGS
jgi:ATP-dependent helicase HrpB